MIKEKTNCLEIIPASGVSKGLTRKDIKLLYVKVKKGAAISVYNKEDIIPAIKDVLYNEEVRKKLAEARKEFIYEDAYIQDGKASKRVVDLIMQMIEESKRKKNEK